MGRCWTWYASMVGSTRPIPLSPGEGVWCISSQAQAMPTYHGWGLLCVRKMPPRKYMGRHSRGAECVIDEHTCPTHCHDRLSLKFLGFLPISLARETGDADLVL